MMLSHNLIGQVQSEACMQQLLDSFKYMKNAAENSKGVHVHYKVSTTYRQSETQELSTSEQTVELFLNRNRSKMVTESATIYRDSVTQVAVMHDRKTVFISDASAKNQAQVAWSGLVQDSLFQHMRLVSCTVAGKGLQKIVLETKPSIRKQLGIQSLTYILNVSSRTFNSVLVQFVPEHQNQRMQVDFLTTDLAYRHHPFSGAAVQTVMQSSTKVKPVYASYKLLDVRKNK